VLGAYNTYDVSQLSPGETEKNSRMPLFLLPIKDSQYFFTKIVSSTLKNDGEAFSLSSFPTTPWKMIGKPFLGN
jgi:hypothetical protein